MRVKRVRAILIQLIRGNSFTHIEGAPRWFLDYATRHLSVPVPLGQLKGARYGKIWWYQGEPWGSLVNVNRVAAGLTPHLEHLAQHYGLQCQVRDIRRPPDEQVPWWSVNVPWRPYQDDIHKKLCGNPTGIINAVPRCLAGDTVVEINRGGKSFALTLEQLVHRFNGGEIRYGKGGAHFTRWDAEIPTLIRAVDEEGFIRLVPLGAAFSSGTKALLSMQTRSGRELRASANHKIMTPQGYRPLGELRQGDLVLEEQPRKALAVRKTRSYRSRCGLVFHPHATHRERRIRGHRVLTSRLVVEANRNGLSFVDYLARLRKGPLGDLEFIDPAKYAVHHKDNDQINDTLENLQVLSHAEHHALHAEQDQGWKHVTARVHAVPIEFIAREGEAPTFDLTVPETGNFLANGIALSNSGKTLMAARIIDSLALPTLYIAPSVAIVRQTYNVFCEHFGEHMVARLDGSAKPDQKDISKPIVIATTPSAAKQSQDWFNTRGVLIIDESHHSAAETYHRINVLAEHIYYRYLFTGTYFRSGPDQLAMEAICSQVIHRVTVADLVPQYLARPKVFFAQVKGKVSGEDWRAAYDNGVVDHEPRNDLVVRIATMLSQDNGIPTIVLTRRRAHADALGERIPDSVVVKGGAAELTSDSIKDFLAGKVQVLVGTTVLGEGVDVPSAAALVYASGGAEGVTMLQSYFRPMTAVKGKEVARIYDFIDSQHRTLRRHSKQRIDFARKHLGDCVIAP